MSSKAQSGSVVELQDRDLEILRGLFETRVMTAEHVAATCFGGRYEAARKRIQKLKAAGYVGERPRRAYDPAVLFLTRKAFAALCARGTIAHLPHMSWPSLEKRVRVSELTLRHELDVQDVRASFHGAFAGADGFTLTEFSTWPLLFQFRAFNPRNEAVTTKPDGFIRINERASTGEEFQHLFFLEVDRSTEPQETLVNRSACYRDYYRRGGLAVRHGRSEAEFDQFPFRVLLVFKNAERRNNTAEKLLLLHPPILTQMWMTTFAEATANPLGAIWTRPIDYRDAIAGTAFGSGTGRDGIYRRNVGREKMVEEEVSKHAIFASQPAVEAMATPDPEKPVSGV